MNSKSLVQEFSATCSFVLTSTLHGSKGGKVCCRTDRWVQGGGKIISDINSEPFLFAVVMERLTDEVGKEILWTLVFAHDTLICSESREQMEKRLERWRYVLETRGMKGSKQDRNHVCELEENRWKS